MGDSTNNNFSGSAGSPVSRLVAALRSDPKKTGALTVLLVLLGVTGGRALLTGNDRPAGASAATAGGSGAARNGTSGNQRGPGSLGSSSLSEQDRFVADALEKWSSAPAAPISRNLFEVHTEYYPVDGSRTPNLGAGDEGFWTRLEKSLASRADQKDKRENLIANFKAEAAKLRLESTMMGPSPKAMVNGTLVGEGSVVASFRVLKIEARRVIVEREGIRLEISMK